MNKYQARRAFFDRIDRAREVREAAMAQPQGEPEGDPFPVGMSIRELERAGLVSPPLPNDEGTDREPTVDGWF